MVLDLNSGYSGLVEDGVVCLFFKSDFKPHILQNAKQIPMIYATKIEIWSDWEA